MIVKNRNNWAILIVMLMGYAGFLNAQQPIKSDFKPGELWLDNNGLQINAHSGGFLFHNKTYYWFGEHKGLGKDGSKAMVGIHVYSSKDLYNWTDEGIALGVSEDTISKLQKGCIIERPKVIYNKKTKKFVMWFHHELKDQGYKAALTGVAIADKITGPYYYIDSYRLHKGILPMNFSQEQFSKAEKLDITNKSNRKQDVVDGLFFVRDFLEGQMSRDMSLFVDDDQTAYHITASEENQTLLVSKLSDDYLSVTNQYIRALPGDVNEAPAVFKKNGKYFMFSSWTTGWRPNPGKLAVADAMMGEWQSLGNPCVGTDDQKNTTFWSQSTFVLPVRGKKNAFIFAADRWNSENLMNSRYVWLPIQFKNNIPFLEWKDSWDLSIFNK